MHTLNRLLTALVLLVLVVAPATFALTGTDERDALERELKMTIDSAVSDYRQRFGLQARAAQGRQLIQEQGKELARIAREKRAVRLEMAGLLAELRTLREREGLDDEELPRLGPLVRQQKRWLLHELREGYLERMVAAETGPVFARGLLGPLTYGSPLADTRDGVTQVVARRTSALARASELTSALAKLEERRETLLADYGEVQDRIDNAVTVVARTEEQTGAIQQIVQAVHSDVLALQNELAAIDARLKRTATRALIEKGLLDPSEALDVRHAGAPTFRWPVLGPISAGYLNEGYRSFFGVPHRGIDIVTDQGTAVASSADGVVFLARNGGATGYSYVLIGHEDGYATLYGHLSVITVASGQEVRGGDVIGLSGGTPGTEGAGPMTTGPHLHFELMKDGGHLDPLSILP